MAERNLNSKIYVEFTDPDTRDNIVSGEEIKTIMGKIHKQFADMNSVAYSGSYDDLSGKPVIDSALSSTSTNAVQNKVIKAELDKKSNTSHTHKYAGSASVGGPATTALSSTKATQDSQGQQIDTTYIKNISSDGTTTVTFTKGDGTTGTFNTKDTTYSAATTSKAGLMSASDKSKLDGITASADSVSFTRSLTSGTKVGTIKINGTSTDLYCQTNTHYASKNVVGSNTATSNTTTALTNGNVYLNSVENGAVTSTHKISGSGATSVTTDASGNIVVSSTNTTYSAATTSKAGLMSASDKAKLDGIEEGAQVNTVTGVKGNSESAYRTGNINITKANIGLSNVENKTSATIRGEITSANVTTALGYTPAELDSDGKVLASQLPSFVDDVLEYESNDAFPETGESGKIYVNTTNNKTYRWSGTSYVEISASLALGETSSTAYRGDRGKIAYDHSQKTSGNPHNVSLTDLGVTATSTELNYVDGVTSNIQTQLNNKAASSHTHSAYVNQNAFSNVTVGSTTVSADSATDTLTLVAGSNITLTPDATNDKITIASKDTTYSAATTSAAGLMSASDKSKLDGITASADSVSFTRSLTSGTKVGTININGTNTDLYCQTNTDTKNTAGSTDTSSKIFLIGATSQATNPQTYSHDTAYVGTDGCLYSNSTKVSVEGHTHNDLSINGNIYDGGSDLSLDLLPTVLGTQTASTNAWTGLSESITSLYDGLTILYYLPYAGTATDATLNLTLANGETTGAIKCYLYGTTALKTQYPKGSFILLTYYNAGSISIDGTPTTNNGWWSHSQYNTNTTYSNATLGQGYGTCTTAESTAAKVVNLSTYTLATGGITAVKFTYAVPASATLNINRKGAKSIYYRGAAITSGVIKAGDIGIFIYNGSQYHLIGIDRNVANATTSLDGLMSASDKAKLDGIADGANNYTHPTYTAKSSGLYKVTVDSTGHVSATTAVTKADITSLGIPSSDTNTHYTSKNVVGSNTATSNTTTALTNGNVYLNSVENGAVTSTHKISGRGATTVTTDASGNIVISSTDNNTTYSAATTSKAGLMSASDKAKLDGIEEGANKITVDSALNTTSTNPVQNMIVTTALNKKVDGCIQLTNEDLDSIKPTVATFYYAGGSNTCTNNPGGSGQAFGLIAYKSANGYVTQELISQSGVKMYRFHNASAWSPWKTIADSSYLKSLSINGNTITYRLGDGTTGTLTTQDTTYSAATTSKAGLMSASDKSKLDGITASADSVSFTRSLTSGTKVGTIKINGTSTDLYCQTNTDTHYTSKNVVGSNTATSNTTTALTNGNVYLNSVENGAVTSSHKISGSGATTVTTDASGNIVISSTDNNTTYSAATASKAGLMSASDKSKLDAITASADSVSFTRSLTSGTKVGTITINGTNTDLYCQTNTDTHYTSKNVVGSNTATSNTTTALTNGNVYLNSVENGAVTSTHKISGSGATSVTTDTSGNIVVSSTNTTYSAATTSKAGLMSASDKSKLDGIEEGAQVNTVTGVKGNSESAYRTGNINITKANIGLSNVENKTSATIRGEITSANVTTALGYTPAELDSDGKVLASQLPSFVDDVLEYDDITAFPETGESGKIYVNTTNNKTYRWSGTSYVEISASLALGETSSTAYRGDRGKIAYDHSQKTSGNPHNVSLTDLGVTATSTELNYVDGVTSNIQTQLNSKAASSHTHSAYVNQNAFSNVTVGSKTLSADNATDTLTLVAGSNITLTPDATNDKITIASKDTTYSAATTSTAGLMSASDKSKLDGITASADSVSISRSLTSGTKSATITINGTATDIYSVTNTDTHYTSKNVVGSNTATSNTTTALTNGNVYLNSVENGAVTSTHKISGRGATSVTTDTSGNIVVSSTNTTYSAATTSKAGLMSASDKAKLDGIATSANNYSLPTASSSTLGGVKTTSTVTSTSGLTACPIISGVPYYKDTNTTYSTATTSANGLMSSSDKSKLDGITASADAVTYTQTLTSGTEVGTININGTDTILYAPTNTDTHYTSKNVVGSNTATSNTTTALTNGNVYLNSVENGAVTSTHKISGSGATTVTTDASGNIVISSTDNNTTYSAATASKAGLMSASDKSKLDAITASADSVSYTASLTSGTKVGTIKINGTDTILYAPTNTDTKVTSTTTNPTSATTYYLPFVTGATTGGVKINNGVRYTSLEGTTSANGYGKLILGNSTATGTAANKYGQIDVYSKSSSYGTIIQADTTSAITHTLPATTGTILNTGTTSFTSSLTSGTKVGTIKINGTSTDLYCQTNTDTHYASKNVVGSNTATSNTTTALTNGNVYLNSVENGAVTSTHKISGSGATKVTTDASGNIIVSSTNTDTKNTAGSTNTSSKIFLIGATSQATNPQTYSHDTAYVGTDGCLYSNSTKVSVEGHTHSYLPLSGGTVTGTVYLTKSQDISGTTTNDGALVIGPSTAEHMLLDGNEIMVKDSSGNPTTININLDGGNVVLGKSGYNVTCNGRLVAQSASTSTAGLVKVDGTTIKISSGVISGVGINKAGASFSKTYTVGYDDSKTTVSGTVGTASEIFNNTSNTVGTGTYAHAEGYLTTAIGNNAHAEGNATVATNSGTHAEGYMTTASGEQAHAEGNRTLASGNQAHAEGYKTKASGSYSHAEGYQTSVSDIGSHVEGCNCSLTGSGYGNHVEGYSNTLADGYGNHVEGYSNTLGSADRYAVHIGGVKCESIKNFSFLHGQWLKVDNSGGLNGLTVVGQYNNNDLSDSTVQSALFIVGNGSYTGTATSVTDYAEDDITRSNAMVVCQSRSNFYNDVYAISNNSIVDRLSGAGGSKGFYIYLNSTEAAGIYSGGSNCYLGSSSKKFYASYITNMYGTIKGSADYAEYMEWSDGNPDNEDRRGLLVTYDIDNIGDGELKIKLANEGDDIVGIVSSAPVVLGDAYDNEWHGKYQKDIYGSIIYDEIEHEDATEEDRIEYVPRISEDYDENKTYIGRNKRPEWSPIGLLGKLVCIDDGSCVIGKYVTAINGVATLSTERTNMRMIQRIDDTHIKVLIK